MNKDERETSLIELGIFLGKSGIDNEYSIEKCDNYLKEYLISILPKEDLALYDFTNDQLLELGTDTVKMRLLRIDYNKFFEVGISHKAKKVLWRDVRDESDDNYKFMLP